MRASRLVTGNTESATHRRKGHPIVCEKRANHCQALREYDVVLMNIGLPLSPTGLNQPFLYLQSIWQREVIELDRSLQAEEKLQHYHLPRKMLVPRWTVLTNVGSAPGSA